MATPDGPLALQVLGMSGDWLWVLERTGIDRPFERVDSSAFTPGTAPRNVRLFHSEREAAQFLQDLKRCGDIAPCLKGPHRVCILRPRYEQVVAGYDVAAIGKEASMHN